MSDYYDRKGQPITSPEWSSALKDISKKRVAETWLTHYWVSTVWLGLNHRFGDGEPLIFETMAFPAENGKVTDWGEVESARYSTEEEALAGHERIVARMKAVEEAQSADAVDPVGGKGTNGPRA